MAEPLSREHRLAVITDLNAISLRVDEAIGRNATNSLTRASLREIRSSLDDLVKKVEQLSMESSALTKREREILKALYSGASARTIATNFSISEPTVKSHIASIYRKLEVNNKTKALAEAVKRGLLP